jgi:peptidyl-prolyl cis-trans isomerase A (cyclophilin A)
VFFFTSCKQHQNPLIIIKTNLGNIEAELFADKAPKTVAAFLSYIDSGYYKNCSFYRVILMESMTPGVNTGVIQGGIWHSNSKLAASLKGIEHESPRQTGLSHTTGTLSLARTTAGSANTEFFICIGDQSGEYDSSRTSHQDGLGFAAFGRVTSGMRIVKEIQNQPSSGDAFVPIIKIASIERN